MVQDSRYKCFFSEFHKAEIKMLAKVVCDIILKLACIYSLAYLLLEEFFFLWFSDWNFCVRSCLPVSVAWLIYNHMDFFPQGQQDGSLR